MGLLDKIRKTKKSEEVEAGSEKKQDVVAKPKKQEEKKTVTKTTVKKGKSIDKAYRIIVKPLVSEKAAFGESKGKYTFVVDANASKGDIKEAIESIYGVKPKGIRTMNYEGKRMRFGYRRGRRSDWKKAVVQVPKGKTLSIHEGV